MIDKIEVGDRLIVNTEDAWSYGKARGVQHDRLLVEITAVTEHNASWKVVEVLSTSGRPPMNPRNHTPGTPGGFARQFFDDLLTEGIYERA